MADRPQPTIPTICEPTAVFWRQCMKERTWMEEPKIDPTSFADSGFVEEAAPSTSTSHGQQFGAGSAIAGQTFAAVAEDQMEFSDGNSGIAAFPKLTGNEGLGAVCDFIDRFNSSAEHFDENQRIRELLRVVEGDAELALRYAIKQEFEDALAQSRPKEYTQILRNMLEVLKGFELEDAQAADVVLPKLLEQEEQVEAKNRSAAAHQHDNGNRNQKTLCWHPEDEDVPPIIGKKHDLGFYIQNQKVSTFLDIQSPVSMMSARQLFELFCNGTLDPGAVKFVQGGPKMIELNGKNVESFGVAVVPIHRINSSPVQVSLVITPVLFGHDLLIGSNAFKSLGLRVFDATAEVRRIEWIRATSGSRASWICRSCGSVGLFEPGKEARSPEFVRCDECSEGRDESRFWNGTRGGNNEGSGDENFKEIRIIVTRKCRSLIQFYASIASKMYLSMVGRRGAELEDRSSGFQRTY